MSGPRPALDAFAAAELGAAARLEPLAGDASDRRYVRARLEDGRTRILMTHAQAFDPPYLPWERMNGFLAELGLPVPGIVSSHPSEGILVLEDIGDESLQSFLLAQPSDAAARERLYAEAVDWIVRLQRGTPVVSPSHPAYHFALDAIRLSRELEYFHEHFVGGLLHEPAAGPQGADVSRALAALAAQAGRPEDRVLCHRDYHSRNLMLPARGAPGARLVIIDFQDARLGPRAYDLASLLEDPYVELTDGLREAMTRRFLDGIGRRALLPEFAAEYAAVAAQRLLKAAGTFAGQATRFGVDRYLAYIPPALARARAALARLPEHRELLRAVERWAAR